jgi:hypothetical protein
MDSFQDALSSATRLRKFIETEKKRACAQDPTDTEGRAKKCDEASEALNQLEKEVGKLADRLLGQWKREIMAGKVVKGLIGPGIL